MPGGGEVNIPPIVAAEPRYQQVEYSAFPDQPPQAVPLWNMDGATWHEAPPPPRWHTHWAQTVGFSQDREVWRCACGAMGGPLEPWALLHRRRVAPGWFGKLRNASGR